MLEDRPGGSYLVSWSAFIIIPVTTGVYVGVLVLGLGAAGLVPQSVLCFRVWSPVELFAPLAAARPGPSRLSPIKASTEEAPAGTVPASHLRALRSDWNRLTGISPLAPHRRPRHSRGRLECISTPLLA